MTDFSFLAKASDIWREWRFEPWSKGTAEGLYRRVTMKKSSLLGEVARYYADDYIIWKYEPGDAERLFAGAAREEGLFLQRFVMLQEKGEYRMNKRSLLFGFRGFAELHFWTPGEAAPKALEDAAFLVTAALKELKLR